MTLTFEKIFRLLNLAFFLSFYTTLPKLIKISQKLLWIIEVTAWKLSFLIVFWPLWPLPVTLTFDHFFRFLTLPSLQHSTSYCHSSSKLVNNVLSYWGNSLKTVLFNGYLTPLTLACDLDLWPIAGLPTVPRFAGMSCEFQIILICPACPANQNFVLPICFQIKKIARESDNWFKSYGGLKITTHQNSILTNLQPLTALTIYIYG